MRIKKCRICSSKKLKSLTIGGKSSDLEIIKHSYLGTFQKVDFHQKWHILTCGFGYVGVGDPFFEIFLEQFAKKSNKNKENDNNLIIDEAISLNAINDNLIDTINKISPYGVGNPKPKFLFHNIKIINPKLVGDTKKAKNLSHFRNFSPLTKKKLYVLSEQN